MANAVQLPQRRKALASVRKGVLDTPIRALVYGSEKVGKSTFAAGAPKPIFLGAENGTERLDVERLQPSTWSEAVEWVNDLSTDAHDYKTLVIDPVNWLEPMCWNSVVADSGLTIETFGGGYGKGYLAALDLWRVFVLGLEKCWRRGMNIVIVAHSQVRTFQNPEGPAFDRYELAMNVKAAGLLKQWVDAVLFARLETFTKVDPATKKAKGYSSGARMLHTQPCAAYDAGARWKLPEELPLSWSDFYEAIQAESGRAEELRKQIVSLSDEIGDAEITKLSAAFIEKNKNNADRLAELVNRLGIKLEEKKKDGAK
jgi:hypothetical protein